MADQITEDFLIKSYYPNAIPGRPYIIGADPCTGKGGTIKIYQGTDALADMFGDLSRKYPTMINFQNVNLMMANPLGYKLPAYKLNTSVLTKLAAITAAGQLGNLLGIANSFVPPGLDGPVEAVKSVISAFTKQMPGLTGAAADIANSIAKITQINTIVKAALNGPAALVFKAIGANFLADIPSLAAKAAALNLQIETAKLLAAARNPIAFAAQAAFMAKTFPMINTDALIMKILTDVSQCKPVNLKSAVPNMALMAGIMALKAVGGKTPVGNAVKPQKTAAPPKPQKPVQMKNLFAEAAAASALSTLTQPLSQFMGLMATIAPQTALVAAGPAVTASGTQKLTGTANTTNWGSGGYGRNNEQAELEKKRLELTAKIEMHTKELESKIDYSKLTSMSYPDLIKKYPRITPTMSVVEALQIIEDTDKKAANNSSTMTA